MALGSKERKGNKPKPMPLRKPAHSNATYEAPTTKVFPGASLRLKRSSLVMPYSSPSQPSWKGRPPTA